MDVKGDTKKRKSTDKPLCKYGLLCYQKNPEHRKKFKHPTEKEKRNSGGRNNSFKDTPSKACAAEEPVNIDKSDVSKMPVADDIPFDEPDETSKSKNIDITFDEPDETSKSKDANDSDYSIKETVGDILKLMPKDFFDFWKFCSSVNKSKPEDAFSEYGYQLVGVFDLLAKNLSKDIKVDISCHWRYYFDPPEFQTVIRKEGKDWYHIGYFRDDPSQKPSVLASNSAAKGPKLTLMGDNIFCAMNDELDKVIKSLRAKASKDKAIKLQKDLEQFALLKKYELNIKTKKTEKRRKQVVAKTFHGFGIVVPVKNDIGYRPLPDSDAVLKNILKKIQSAETDKKRLQEEEALDELISNVHIANDELDYGMGLELGIDLFCNGDPYFHSDCLRLLTLAYDLLGRSKYGAVIKAHLKNRKKGDELGTLNI